MSGRFVRDGEGEGGKKNERWKRTVAVEVGHLLGENNSCIISFLRWDERLFGASSLCVREEKKRKEKRRKNDDETRRVQFLVLLSFVRSRTSELHPYSPLSSTLDTNDQGSGTASRPTGFRTDDLGPCPDGIPTNSR